MAENWNHDKLAEDLGQTLNTRYRQVPLGSVQMQHAQLADVVTIKPSYTRFCLHIYEIKVQRSDFLKDIRSGKWQGYLDHCHRIYFAVPAGLIKKEEIPAEAGLIVRGPKGWNVQKAAPKRPIDVPATTLYSMLFMKNRLTVRDRNLEAALGRSGSWGDWDGKKRQARHLGKRISKALVTEEEAIKTRDALQCDLKRFRSAIREGLGVELEDEPWVTWELQNLVQEIKRKAK